MTEGLWAAVIGVGGTLLGTILGWWLNAFSNHGKISASLLTWNFKLQRINSIPETGDEIKEFVIGLKIDIQNNSNSYRFMRNINLVFFNEENKTHKILIPFDNALTIRKEPFSTTYKQILPLNLAPKSIIQKSLSLRLSYTTEKWLQISQANAVYLQYRNEKDKIKKILLRTGDITKAINKETDDE